MGYGARMASSWGYLRIQHWIFGFPLSHVAGLEARHLINLVQYAEKGISSPKWRIFWFLKCGKLLMMPYLSSFWQKKPPPAASNSARKYRCPPPLHLQMMAMSAGDTAQMPLFSALKATAHCLERIKVRAKCEFLSPSNGPDWS